jgi:hypothetical protein
VTGDFPEPERDYTVESGMLVFTAGYLRRRGFCCGSRCRNCPYPPHVQDVAVRRAAEGRPLASVDDMEAALREERRE